MGNKNIEPRDAGGLAIFDNAIQRAVPLPRSGADTFKLAWGKDATRLYAHSDPVGEPQSFSILAIDSTGVSTRVFTENSLTNVGLRPHYDAGTDLVYSDGGRITNPADGTAAGVLTTGVPTLSGLMVPDSTLNRAFVLHQDSTTSLTYDLDIYDLTRQTFLKTISIPGVIGYPTQLVRWGTQGIAFLTDIQIPNNGTGMLYLLQSSDISGVNTPPGSVTLSPTIVAEGNSASTTITITGSNFTPSSIVEVNGSAGQQPLSARASSPSN